MSMPATTPRACHGHTGVPLHFGRPSRGSRPVFQIGSESHAGVVKPISGKKLGKVDTYICRICGGILR